MGWRHSQPPASKGKTMSPAAKAIIAVLGALVIVLLAAVLTAGDGGMPMHRDNGPAGGYAGMLQAMGDRDTDRMLDRMRELLGDDAYQLMLEHFAEHRRGAATDDPRIDSMMHRMMDGLMEQMPAGRDGMPMHPY